jgi:transposase InsO family protein
MPFPVRAIPVDDGSAFMADFEADGQVAGVPRSVLPPRSPKRNSHVERAHRTRRQEFSECYDGDLEIPVLQQALQEGEYGYNHRRPHQALGYQTPAAYLATLQTTPLSQTS